MEGQESGGDGQGARPITPRAQVVIQGQAVSCVTLDCKMARLFEKAYCEANEHSRAWGGDCEGTPLSSRPVSPMPANNLSGVDLVPAADVLDGATGSEMSHHERQQGNKKSRRQVKRQAAASDRTFSDHKPKKSSLQYHKKAARVFGHFDPTKLTYSKSGAWIGVRQAPKQEGPWQLDDLIANQGFKLFAWKGAPTLIVDKSDRIGAVLVGAPNAADWAQVQNDVVQLMEGVREEGLRYDILKAEDLNHRRGEFTAIATGVSYGGGGTKPGNLRHDSDGRKRMVHKLRSNRSMQRVAGFQSAAFATFAPKLFKYYATTMDELFKKNEGLQENFKNSVFPASSFNCGPQTVSRDHKDHGNLSFGLCALTAFGNYDPTVGGHLIFFEMKLVVEFPPGCTILLPSAAVTHANTPIGKDETRYSFAQYAAGGLFRWVTYGHRAVKGLKQEIQNLVDGPDGLRWEEGLAMYSKAAELDGDIKAAFFTK